MKKQIFAFLTAFALAFPAFSAEETRMIRLIQDDAQEKMATKVYTLKHLKASDLIIFVQAAVGRYYATSSVRALNFPGAKQQCLIVTTAEKFIPYLDQIISTLDRGSQKDNFNSAISGTGYRWKVYYPAYRSVKDLVTPANVMLSGNGNVFIENGALWIKDDMDDVDYALEWVQYFDRPVPQVKVTLRYYSVRESTLRDVGIDYLSWKNGPGMNLFDFAYSSGRVAWDKILNTAFTTASSASWAYGGFMTAPAFDMSFVRLLQQSGDAKILATADVVVTNNHDATIYLQPSLNRIVKDENHATSIVADDNPDFKFNLKTPTICFFTEDKEVTEYGWIPVSPEFYARNKGSLGFSYDFTSSNDTKEISNLGNTVQGRTYSSCSWKAFDLGHEQLLVSSEQSYDIEQTTGVPFLCQLPVLKYIFGTTTTSKETNYIFVTLEANLLHPDILAKKEVPAEKVKVVEKMEPAAPAEKPAEKAAAPAEKPAEKAAAPAEKPAEKAAAPAENVKK